MFVLAWPLGCASHANEHEETADAAVADSGTLTEDDALFEPAGLANPLRSGDQASGLTLIALTLVQTGTGAALYAAVRNDGATPSCEAGMLTDFIDATDAISASAGTTLQTSHFYRTSAGAIIPCIDPGEVALGASTDLPASVVIAQLGSLDHAFPAFTVGDLTPLSGFTVSELTQVTTAAGTAFSGVLTNGFDVTATSASVNVFSLNRVGRPLAVVSASAPDSLTAGQTWQFQTEALDVSGASAVALPTATFAN